MGGSFLDNLYGTVPYQPAPEGDVDSKKKRGKAIRKLFSRFRKTKRKNKQKNTVSQEMFEESETCSSYYSRNAHHAHSSSVAQVNTDLPGPSKSAVSKLMFKDDGPSSPSYRNDAGPSSPCYRNSAFNSTTTLMYEGTNTLEPSKKRGKSGKRDTSSPIFRDSTTSAHSLGAKLNRMNKTVNLFDYASIILEDFEIHQRVQDSLMKTLQVINMQLDEMWE